MIASISKLLTVLHRDRHFFEQMFEKRHRMVGLHEVLESIEEEKLAFLLESELLVNHEEFYELDDRLLSFFEEMLDASADIEIGDVDEMLDNMAHHIELYENEAVLESKERHLMKIQRILKKIPQMILKNLNALQLHIGLSYKTQKIHAQKLAELKHYRQKLQKLIAIEAKVEKTLEHQSYFFKYLSNHETVILTLRLKNRLRELRISLASLQEEVIAYINRSVANLGFYEHMIKLKELKNSLELKERTNILNLIEAHRFALSFEKLFYPSAHLEREYIYEELFMEQVDKIREHIALPKLELKRVAEVDESFFKLGHEPLSMVDTDALHTRFMQGDDELFHFVQSYAFEQDKSFAQRIEIYCQMALMYEEFYHFTQEFEQFEAFEYLKIYPKKEAA